MNARWIRFGEIEVEGRRYDHDVVIEGGMVTKRSKKPSKTYRGGLGHTPLSRDEEIPWGDRRLIVGTGENGALPVMREVYEEAEYREVELVALPTPEAIGLIRRLDGDEVYAILHVTC